jgi:hypothetical protein
MAASSDGLGAARRSAGQARDDPDQNPPRVEPSTDPKQHWLSQFSDRLPLPPRRAIDHDGWMAMERRVRLVVGCTAQR